MSKKNGITIVAIIVAVAAILFGWKYYADTYQGKTAYAVVPTEVPTKTQVKDADGKMVVGSYEYKYKFNFVLENGDKRTEEYGLSADDDNKPFAPGSIVKVEMSKKRINKGPNEVDKKDVPKKVLNELKD